MLTIASLAVVPVAGQDPDLSGIYVNNDATPLNRPKELEGRPYLTDAEVTELQKRADRLFKHGDNEAASGDNVFLAAWRTSIIIKTRLGTRPPAPRK